MSGFVIDASVALARCFEDEATAATRALLARFAADAAEVLSVWHLGLANALALAERRRRISAARAAEFVGLVARLPIVVDEKTAWRALDAVLDLARSAGLIACGAPYFDPAMRRGLPFAIGDRELARASRRRDRPADGSGLGKSAQTTKRAAQSVFSLTEQAVLRLAERIHALLQSLRDTTQARSALGSKPNQRSDRNGCYGW